MTLQSCLRHASSFFPWGHPGDAELLAMAVPGPTRGSGRTVSHVRQCDDCAERVAALHRFVEAVSEDGRRTAADTITSERLATQRQRVMRRIRRSLEPPTPARVLRFPAGARPALAGMHRATRWLGAALAAGLVVGVSIGQYLHLHPVPPVDDRVASGSPLVESGRPETETAAGAPPAASLAASAAVTPAATLLDEVDLVLTTPRIAELTPLDEFTPRIREVAINPW